MGYWVNLKADISFVITAGRYKDFARDNACQNEMGHKYPYIEIASILDAHEQHLMEEALFRSPTFQPNATNAADKGHWIGIEFDSAMSKYNWKSPSSSIDINNFGYTNWGFEQGMSDPGQPYGCTGFADAKWDDCTGGAEEFYVICKVR